MLKARQEKEVFEPIDELQSIARARPDDPKAQRRLGWALYSSKRFDEARQVLEAARSRFPADVEVLYALGLTLKSIGEKKQALEAFQAVVEGLERVEDNVRHSMLRHLAKRQAEIAEKES